MEKFKAKVLGVWDGLSQKAQWGVLAGVGFVAGLVIGSNF